MGSLRDQAEAQAETEIRKKVHAYRSAKQPDGRAWIYGPFSVPQWIEWAAAYLEKVVIAYAREVLDPAAADPFERVAELERYHLERADYLFDKYFASDAESWNGRPEENRYEKDFPNPIDKSVFRMLISTYPTLSIYGSVTEWVEQAVSEFWEKRFAVKSGESIPNTQEIDGIPTLSTPEGSRDLRQVKQLEEGLPNRASRLKEQPAERAWMSRYSANDEKVYRLVGENNFRLLTNEEISRRFTRSIRSQLGRDVSPDALRARLNRIRRYHHFPESCNLRKKAVND